MRARILFATSLLGVSYLWAATPLGTIPVGNSPFALALNATNTQAVVVNLFPVKNPDGSDGPNVRVLDVINRSTLRTLRVGTRLVSVTVTGTTALVVNEDQDAVRVVDLNTGLEVAVIAVGSRPSSVSVASTTTAIATNGTSGDITFIDVPNRRVTGSPLKVGSDPRAVALHPGGRYAYVALGGDNAIAIVDLSTTPQQVLANKLGVGKNPTAVRFSPNGTRAVVANLTSNSITVIDTTNPAAPQVLRNIQVGVQPTAMAFNPNNQNMVYVSNQGSQFFSVVDISRDRATALLGVVQMQSLSSGIAVSNDGSRLYITEFKNDANLRIYDLNNLGTLDPVPAIDIPGEPLVVQRLTARGNCSTDFYVAEAALAPGAREGFWGMEVALSTAAGVSRELTGGFNLGGAFDGNGQNPGFGAFSLSGSGTQRVNFTINAQSLGGAFTLKVDLNSGSTRVGGVQGTPTASTPLTFTADLQSGFYVIVVSTLAGSSKGTFQMGLEAPGGSFNGGVVVGGFLTRDTAGNSLTGFGAFCVPQTQDVTIRLVGNSEYGTAAAGDLIMTIKDASRAVIRTVDNSLSSGGSVPAPTPPAVPATINYYVDAAAAATGGDGTSARPFRSITAAINRATAGQVIFVRAGTYSVSKTGETLPLGSPPTTFLGFRPNVQLVGAGAETTIIDGETTGSNLMVIPAAGVRVAGFTIKRAPQIGIYVFQSANVILENNLFIGNNRFGAGAINSSGLIVRNNVAVSNLESGLAFSGSVPSTLPPGAPTNCPTSAAGNYGAWIINNIANDNRADGILVSAGGNYCIANNTTVNNGSSGVEFNNRAEGSAVPALNGAVVNNTITGNGAQQFAFAGTGILSTENNARIDLIQGNKLAKNRPYAIGIFLNGRAGKITQNTVTDTQSNAILIRSQATVDEVSDNIVQNNGDAGLFVDDGSTVGSILRNTVTFNTKGLQVTDGCTVTTVDANTFDDNRSIGLEVAGARVSRITTVSNTSISNNGAGSAASGSGVQVRDSSVITAFNNNRLINNQGQGGIYLSTGGQITANNTTIDGSVTQGLASIGAGCSARLTGGSISNTKKDAAGQGGFGINAQSGGSVTCSGTTFSSNATGNVFSGNGGNVSGCQ